MDDYEYILLAAVVLIPLAAYFLGYRVRELSHSIVPFRDPISLLFMVLSFLPLILDSLGHGIIDPGNVWLLAGLLGFWAGYCVGYCSNTVDLVYVAVHRIADRTQDVDYIVKYRNRDGQLCWQPQTFRAICKSMILGVHNPLQLVEVGRTRRVTVKQLFRPRVEVDAIDLAGVESNVYTIKRGPKGRINWTVQSLKYTPSPHCTDAPYDWIANALGYEELFQQYSSLQVEHLETGAKLRTAAMRGAGELLSAMGSKTPSSVVMEQLGMDLEKLYGIAKRDDKRVKQEVREDA